MANAKYFLKRFAMALLTIFLVACLTFLLMNAVPGSPWLSEKTPSAATLAALNAKYGLDKPVHVQLYMYLKLWRVPEDAEKPRSSGHYR